MVKSEITRTDSSSKSVASTCVHRSKNQFASRLRPKLLTLATVLAATSAVADDIRWQVGTGNWFTAANWTDYSRPDGMGGFLHFTPGASDQVQVANGGAPQIAGAAAANTLYLSSVSSISLVAGSLSVVNQLDVGKFPGDNSTFSLQGGTVTVGNDFRFGVDGTGTLYQSGGTINTQWLGMGVYTGNGQFNLSGGTVNASFYEEVGHSGTGTLVQTGGNNMPVNEMVANGPGSVGTYIHSAGQHQVSNNITIGNQAGSSGRYTLSGTGSLVSGSEYIGWNGVGQFTQNGGTNTTPVIYIAINPATSPSGYSLSGGTLSVNNVEFVGFHGSGSFTQNGGRNTLAGTSGGTGPLIMAYHTGSTGDYALSAGILETVACNETVGMNGAGTFTQTGGSNTTSDLHLGINDGTGTYTISDGTLVANNVFSNERLFAGGPGGGAFNVTGGGVTINSALSLGVATGGSNTGTLSGTGSLAVGGNETIGVSGSATFTQTGGTHVVTGAVTVAANLGSTGLFSLSGGTLTAGSVQTNTGGTFSNSAIMTLNGPGTSTSTTSTGGLFTQTPGGTLNVTLSGTGNGQFGQIVVGSASLAGTLNISLAPGYSPTIGSRYRILRARTMNGASGEFATTNLPPEFHLSYFKDACTNESGVELVYGPYVPRLKQWDRSTNSWTGVAPSSITCGNVHVLVHGWAPFENPSIFAGDAGSFGDWRALADAIAAADPNGVVLMFSWIDGSSTPCLCPIGSRVSALGFGDVLAVTLPQTLAPSFSTNGGKTHLIGHSHGALVSTIAAVGLAQSGMRPRHLTIFDAPEGGAQYLGANDNLDQWLVLLGAGRGVNQTFVDNYYSQFGIPYGLPTGTNGVVNVKMNVNTPNPLYNHGYPIIAYRDWTNQGRFALKWSPIVSPNENNLLAMCYERLDSLPSPGVLLPNGCGYVPQYPSARPVQPATQSTFGSVDVLSFLTRLFEGSPAAWATTVTSAPGDTAFVFDYQWTIPGDGDQLLVYVDGQQRFFSQGNSTGSTTRLAVIDIGDLTAGTHTFDFYLNSVGASNAAVRVSNFGLSSGCATIVTHPDSAIVCNDATANFSVEASGVGSVTYQWQWQPAGTATAWVNLVAGDNADIGGALVVHAANVGAASLETRPLAGYINFAPRAFRCIVTNACGSVVSNEATLTICPGDFNCDDVADFFDYLDFVAAFADGGASADFNHDGVIDFFDYLDFVNAFSSGC